MVSSGDTVQEKTDLSRGQENKAPGLQILLNSILTQQFGSNRIPEVGTSLAKVFEGLVFKIKLVIQNSFYNQWRRITPENILFKDRNQRWVNNMSSGILSLLRWIKRVQPRN